LIGIGESKKVWVVRMKAIEHSEVCPRGGFTLVELLAVIAVIAVVASLIIGAAGIAGKKADEARAQSDIQLIAGALESYRTDFGSYIDVGTDLVGMERVEFGDLADHLTDDRFRIYTNKIDRIVVAFDDPWGNDYQYRSFPNNQGIVTTYEIRSKGPEPEVVEDDISNRR
jgi:general secretion pathway protein G